MNFKKELFKYYLIKMLDVISFLSRINLVLNKKMQNTYFKIPIIKRIGIYNLVDGELWLNKIITTLQIKKKGAFVDVGVNIGQTLLKVMSINPNTNYLGFEPNPVCNFYVYKLIEANSFSNVSLYPIGLSNENNLLELYADNEYASGASVIKNFRKKGNIKFIYHVPLFKGDMVLNDLNDDISIIKIDVEGFEFEVIDGFTATIKKHKPFIICEVLPIYSVDEPNGLLRKQRQDSLLNTLQELEYKIMRIDELNVKLTALDIIEVHGDMNKTNYIFCHKNNLNLISELMK